ncbi:MAG: hypothetical protein DWQ36_12515 [Acidobacteria bacterium]|nr:MAG: hypothetical protein DWQ30_24910 [Acidobacteriota bacterium]REK07361.1 MAG: hypothetical protein DWQ36_12515 [Acidobacteriota bacterium]
MRQSRYTSYGADELDWNGSDLDSESDPFDRAPRHDSDSRRRRKQNRRGEREDRWAALDRESARPRQQRRGGGDPFLEWDRGSAPERGRRDRPRNDRREH